MKNLILIIAFLFSSNVNAVEFKGVQFPDQVKVSDTTLKVNGLGIRKVYGIMIVYAAALYTQNQSSDSKAILDSKTPKQLIMHFKRWVEKSKILEAWEAGLKKNKPENYDYKEDFKKLTALMSHMKENEEIIITFLNDGAVIKVKDNPEQKIEGADFSKTLLSVFINNAPDPDLKSGLLNQTK